MDEATFVQRCQGLAPIDLFAARPPAPPWRAQGAPVRNLRSGVEASARYLPLAFEGAFVAPFEGCLAPPAGARSSDTALIEMLGGAIYEHAPNCALVADLRRFPTVSSDLYQSFLDRNKRAVANLPLSETSPPVAAFEGLGDDGRFTLLMGGVQQLIGETVERRQPGRRLRR